MILNEREARQEQVLRMAQQIMTAARTAPKGKGMDVIEIATITGEDIEKLSRHMRILAEENGLKFFLRDADNLHEADAVIVIGTRNQTHGMNCAHCGYPTCAGKPASVPCAINVVDVGIAVGSACATAADLRADTRVMFSAGLAAQRLGIPENCSCVMALPVSATSKNPFFDRKPAPPAPPLSDHPR